MKAELVNLWKASHLTNSNLSSDPIMIVFSLVCLVTTSPTHLMLLRHQLSSMLDNIMRDWSIKSVGDFLQTLWLNVVFSLCLFVILLISRDQGCNCEKLCLKGNPEVPESRANLLQIWQNNHKKMHPRDLHLSNYYVLNCLLILLSGNEQLPSNLSNFPVLKSYFEESIFGIFRHLN